MSYPIFRGRHVTGDPRNTNTHEQMVGIARDARYTIFGHILHGIADKSLERAKGVAYDFDHDTGEITLGTVGYREIADAYNLKPINAQVWPHRSAGEFIRDMKTEGYIAGNRLLGYHPTEKGFELLRLANCTLMNTSADVAELGQDARPVLAPAEAMG